MADSHSRNVKDLIKSIVELHTPENPELKDGFGHDIEHIKGVLMRGLYAANVIYACPTDYNLQIDLEIIGMCLAAHDIGNLISRKGHNHIGYGIIKGDLPLEDILDVPMEVDGKTGKTIISKRTVNEVKYYLTDYGESLRYIEELSDLGQKALINAALIQTKFKIGYNNIEPDKLETYLVAHFELDRDSELLADMKDYLLDYDEFGNLIYNDIEYGEELYEKLHQKTEEIHHYFPSGSIGEKLIAEAVQDHNVDYERLPGAKEPNRYRGRSIYSILTADSDKDCCAKTFAMRSYLYGCNKLKQEDMEQNIKGVLEQTNDRYRPSAEKFGKVMQLMPHSFENHIDKLKCVMLVDDDKEKDLVAKGLGDYINVIEEDIGKNKAGTKYFIQMEKGDDLYSQLDELYNINLFADLWDDLTHVTIRWANPEMLETSMGEIKDIINNDLIPAKTIEEAVDNVEKSFWSDKLEINVNKYNLNEILDIFIDDEYISINSQVNENLHLAMLLASGSINYDEEEYAEHEESVFFALSIPNAENLTPSGDNFDWLGVDVVFKDDKVIVAETEGTDHEVVIATIDEYSILNPNIDVIDEIMLEIFELPNADDLADLADLYDPDDLDSDDLDQAD